MSLIIPSIKADAIDFYRQLYRGVDSNGKQIKTYPILGRREGFSSTNNLEDIAEFLSSSIVPVPTGSESWEIVSDDTQDSASGTGIRQVKINYLDNNYVESTVQVALNGVTPVAIPAMTNCQYINWMHGKVWGSGKLAAGTIDLRIAGGGATYERIAVGGNMSLSCRFMVPDGFFAVVDPWNPSCSTNHQQDLRLRATQDRSSLEIVDGFLFQDIVALTNNTQSVNSLPKVYGPRTALKVSTQTSSALAKVSVSFPALLVEI